MGKQYWTPKEAERLKESWGTISPEDLIAKFQRSWGSLRMKARRLGLPATYGPYSERPPQEFRDAAFLEKENRRLRKSIAEVETQNSIFRTFMERAFEGYEPLPFYWEPSKSKRHEKPEIAILLFSDPQYGAYVSRATLGGLGEYSTGAFVDRLGRLRESIIEIVEIQRKSVKVDELYIAALGDYVEGEEIYLGQLYDIEIPLLRQVVELGDLVPAQFFAPLCSYFKEVHFRGVPGNHGQKRPSPSNWDIDAMYHWQLRMREHKNFDIHFEWDKTWTQFKVKDPDTRKFWPQTFHLVHGHELRAYHGKWPMYGLEQILARFMKLVNTPINWFFMGHHHRALFRPEMWGGIGFNGSFQGGSKYSMEKMTAVDPPTQLLLFMNRDHLTRVDFLFLADQPKLGYDKQGVLTYDLSDT